MNRVIHKVQPTTPAIPQRMRVAAYARVSNDKMAMVESLAAQVSYYSAYIQRNPQWIYVGVFADEGLSGTKDNRPEFQRLISDCYAGKIDMVITKSLSRFSRNTLDTLNILRELKQRGVDVFFERENIHSNSGDGELMLTILSSYAQEESRSASENIKWRIRKKFEQGEISGWCQLYGYKIRRGKVMVDDYKAAIVRRIFEEYLAGDSATVIAKRLRLEGVPCEQGGQWKQFTVSEILRNEKYTGNQLLQKTFTKDHLSKRAKKNQGELPLYLVENAHPAIIDADTNQRVMKRMEGNQKAVKRPEPKMDEQLFRRKIICSHCGRHFIRKNTNGTPGYVCSTYSAEGKDFCLSKKIPETTLVEFSLKALGLPEFDKKLFDKEIDHIIARYPNDLAFVFRGGHTREYTWEDRSRVESWTDEMKKLAGDKTRSRIRSNSHGSHQESHEN